MVGVYVGLVRLVVVVHVFMHIVAVLRDFFVLLKGLAILVK